MSILSKCVPASQLGKMFSILAAFQILVGMGMGYLNTMVTKLGYEPNIPMPMLQLYNATLDSFLGASYCLSAGFELLSMIGMVVVYWYIAKNERKFGPLGEREERKEA